MSYVDNESAYEAAIARRIAKACRDKFNNKFIPAHPEVDWERARTSRNRFVHEMLESGAKYGKLSDKQLAAITKSFERDDEREALRECEKQELIDAGVKAPSGRQIVRGTIRSKRYEVTQCGAVCKVLIIHETGWKAWCSLPEIIDGADVGDVIEFTITLEPSPNDVLFAIGKRPAKASIISHMQVACN